MTWVWVSSLGVNVPFDVWLEAYNERRACFRVCAADQNNCVQGCLSALDSTPAAPACIAGCKPVHAACISRCLLNWWATLGFHGVPRDESDPVPNLNDHKETFRNTRKTFENAGSRYSYISGILDWFPNPLPTEVTQTISALGTFGIGLQLIAHYLKRAEEDPPDEQFEEVWLPREIDIPQVVQSDLYGSEFGTIVLPFVSHALLTVSYVEGIAVSLDRASAALAADVRDKHLAQLRVSKSYAAACADECRKMQASRILIAGKLVEFGLDRIGGDAGLRIAISGDAAEFNLEVDRYSGRQDIISFDNALALQNEWNSNGISEPIANLIAELSPSKELSEWMFENILSAELEREDFDKFLSEVLNSADLVYAENLVTDTLESWGRAHGDA